MRRDVQQSLLPELERPVGRIPASLVVGTNADLIRSVAPLYLEGRVLDVTYGRGSWWRTFRPAAFECHDLALDGVDFRALPDPDRSFDAVCFDPPYIPAGGGSTTARADRFRDRFGLLPNSHDGLWEMIGAGLEECARVSRRWVLAKCCDYVDGGRFKLAHLHMLEAGARLGLTVHDLLILGGGTGPGGHNILTVKRARRAHSYLIVFEVPDAEG